MVPPGVSYMPRDFMPTKRFSTRSSRPMPLARPSSLSCVSSVAGDSFLPSIATASPRSKSTVMYGRLVRRVLRIDRCANRRSPALPAPGPPAPLPSDEACSRLASTENGASPRLSLAIGIWCFSANSISLVREVEVPFAPRRDHLHVGLERIVGELEAHLVVALAGRAVRDRVGADLLGDLDLLLGDQRPRDRGAEQILPLVDARWRGTSGTRSRARTPRADPR